jgi:hypothetical protein
MVPGAGVEPARPCGQRILSPHIASSPTLTKQYEPVFSGLIAVQVRLGLAQYSYALASS